MASGISCVTLTSDLYETWDSFCAESEEAWFWHTTKWLDYNLAYRPALNAISYSFLVYDNAKLVAICPIIVQNASVDDPGVRMISYPSGHGMTPALASRLQRSDKRRIWQACLERIDAIAADSQVKQASLWMTPLTEAGRSLMETSEQLDGLRRAGYLETVWLTSMIDLSLDEKKLRNQMRKGHRYDTGRSVELYQTQVLFGPQTDRLLFDVYVRLHELVAGRKTRPQQTFDMMYSWLLNGKAVLTLAQREKTDVGACLVMLDKDGGYYASSCVHPDFIDEPVGHAMQWATMHWMKANGYRWYELGHIRYGVLPHNPASEKEVRISHYERGFGGIPMMFVVVEKYYSREFYLKTAKERVECYAATDCMYGK
jgi:hypothetical protein